MAIEGGMKCVKFLVFFFNFIFWVCGVALIAIGIYVLVAPGRAPVVPVGGSGWTPVGIVVLGVVIFFTSFFGCCGAWKESYCMVTTFAVLLSLIFLVEIAAAITGYVFKHKVHGLVEEGLWEAVRSYEQDPSLAAALDKIQQEFSCCGVNNFTDWASVGRFGANDSVPSSCCRRPGAACNVHPSPATVFAEGCLPSLEAWVKRNMLVLAAMALGIAFFEVLGVLFSCCLMRGIRSGYEVM
ncbi:CD63 antigen [Haemorhous mexicanus]|uniref:CD63 antigen n=1 Tax=Haemorhous mexicanus TaxID=30427 RepID=UPI0028BEA522|nr:CD63 antigen [Haemorhous mexicanus]XP_059727859.1 CD63 antigen [Haemorhous mexicanus]